MKLLIVLCSSLQLNGIK